MNAENLGFEDDSFDIALCGFVGWDYCYDFIICDFTGPDTRSREIWRVLREGGNICISSWEYQEDIEWLATIFTQHYPSISAENVQDGIRRPLVYSKETPAGYRAILDNAGFKEIMIFREKAEFVSVDEESWWEQMRRLGWYRYFDKIEALGMDKLKRFKEVVFESLQEHRIADGFRFNKQVFFATGKK